MDVLFNLGPGQDNSLCLFILKATLGFVVWFKLVTSVAGNKGDTAPPRHKLHHD